METNLRDAIQEYEREYGHLNEKDRHGLSKNEHMAVTMAAKALDTQKDILKRIEALEDKEEGRRLQLTSEERIIHDINTRNAAQTREMYADIARRELEEHQANEGGNESS